MNTDQQPEDSSAQNPQSQDSAPEAAPTPPPTPPQSATPAPASEPAASGLSKDSLNMGMLCHLLAFSGFFTAGAGNILGPLILWLMKKDGDPYVDKQGKESLNFQISMFIYFIVAGLLLFVFIGIILLPLLGIAWLVLTIIGTMKASKGEPWQYPLTIRLIK